MKYLLILAIGLSSCAAPTLHTPEPFPLDERTCNLILDGDCGMFESDADGIVAGATWSFTRLDTISYQGDWAIQSVLTVTTLYDTILLQDDSIEVDSGHIYNIMAYVYVDETVLENFPQVGVSYEPKGEDTLLLSENWIGEAGLDQWFRVRLTFRAVSTKKIRCHVYGVNLRVPVVILYIDKFKLMNAATNNRDKCCGVIPD